MKQFKALGTEAVTITGGGEPLLHPHINELISYIKTSLEIDVGLVTNGTKLDVLEDHVFRDITWCRISHDDNRKFDERYKAMLSKVVEDGCMIDWAFSYVLTRTPNYDTIADIIEFANEHNFTHVRIVSDLLDLDAVENMGTIKRVMRLKNIDDEKVVYQGRKDWVKGTRKCWMSLLKPTVGANGYLYPCCGAQYAEEEPSRNYGETMRFCHYSEIDKIWKDQRPFDGTICEKCYYANYNEALDIMISDLEHKTFI
jgi:MoaA/NifB/PqqE/SkfB family radical SAM enzyme